jgi:hypothetical protein
MTKERNVTRSNGNGNPDHHDRLIAEAAARAAELLGGETGLGKLLWAINGQRAYERYDGATSVLSIVGPGGHLITYIIEGVDLETLR